MKFLHLADTHIGVENYGRLDPGSGLHTRLQDFVGCLRFAFEAAIRQRVDFVVFCGDAYKTCDPTPTHQREFAAQVRTLVNAGTPVVMVVGNHDNPVSFGRASSLNIYGTLAISNVHVIEKPCMLRLKTKSGPVQIVGLPWPTRNVLITKDEYKDLSDDEILAQIQRICTGIIEDYAHKLDPAVPAILAAHLACSDAVYSGSERSAMIGNDPVLMTSAVANPAFDYVALGHIHRHQNLNEHGAPPVVYSGSIERIDFGEEHESKGFCLVQIEDCPGDAQARPTTYEFIEAPARRFLTIQVPVDQHQDPTVAILREVARHNLENAVVRVIYEVSEAQQHLVDLGRVRAALESAFLVAGILPKPAPVQHLRRVEVSEDLGVAEALDRYIANRPELECLRDDLKRYAAALEAELEAPASVGDSPEQNR